MTETISIARQCKARRVLLTPKRPQMIQPLDARERAFELGLPIEGRDIALVLGAPLAGGPAA